MSARLLVIAGSLVAGALVAHFAGAPKQQQQAPPRPRRRTKRVPRPAAARGGHSVDGTALGGAGGLVGVASQPPVPALGTAALALLLLQTVLSLAAVLFADQLRPATFGSSEWRRLVTAAALGASTLGLAAHSLAALLAPRPAPAALAAAPLVPPPLPLAALPLADLSGTWIKDVAASDSMQEACDAMRLGGLVRTAIRLIRGLELRMDGRQFTMSVLSGILWFKVTERYSLDGTAAHCRRRDLRRGGHIGRVERCPASGDLLLRLEWGPPLGGVGLDRFTLVQPGLLHVRTDLEVEGRQVSYTQVYRRK